MRQELRDLAESARRLDGQSETAQWQAVSSFVIAFAGAQKTFAASTLPFKSDDHRRWCEAIMEASKPESCVENPYDTFIASNPAAKDYLDYMYRRSLQEW